MDDPAISVQNLSKAYTIWRNPHARLSGGIARHLRGAESLPKAIRGIAGKHYSGVCCEFHALRDISFEIPKGESVGIVGRNGSGKSTLLKIIAGTLRPTVGSVQVEGRVAALLELGSGFNPEFTGRENVNINAAILGLTTRQIESKLDSILEFANIGDFIDRPVKTYSSGMMLRLAFAVQTAVEPDILIIDEALSVGDERFRRKCFARMEDLRESGATLLFVSHDRGSVLNLTRRAMFLHRGELIMDGSPKVVVGAYDRFLNVKEGGEAALIDQLKRTVPIQAEEVSSSQENMSGEASSIPQYEVEDFHLSLISQSTVSYDQHGASIEEVHISNEAGKRVNVLCRGRKYFYKYTVRFDRDCRDVSFSMLIKTLKGVELGGARTLPLGKFHPLVKSGQSVEIQFAFDCLLMPGVYFLNAGVEGDLDGRRSYVHRLIDAEMFRVASESHPLPTGLIDFRIEPICHFMGE